MSEQVMIDFILRRVAEKSTIDEIDAAVRARCPAATEDEIRGAWRKAAEIIKEDADRLFAEAAELRRQAQQNHEVIAELVEISLETGIPLSGKTVAFDFVRQAAETGNPRALTLLDMFPR